MSFESELRAHIQSSATISGLCGDRISPSIRREGTAVPAITYSLVYDDRQMNLGGVDSSLRNIRVQIDIWANTLANVLTIEEALITQMNTAATNFKSVTLGTQVDDYETETKLYRRTREFSVWYGV